jgi:hypothetical protein
MKFHKILRISGVTLILSLLLAVIPAAPAAAAETIVISPTQVKLGDRVNYSGAGYIASATTQYYIDIYMSDQVAAINNSIDSQVTRYYKVVFGSPLDEAGTFSGSFTLPTTLNQGTVGTATPVTLAPNTSYYVYATQYYQYSTNLTPSKLIKALTTAYVTQGATLNPLSVTSGAASTSVSVSGVNFPAGAISITFDVSPLTITSGNTQTSGGSFISTVTVPSTATVGAHNIVVTVGSTSATAQFTVTASPSLDPLTPAEGPVGTDVTVSGASFPVNTQITFQFDQTVIIPTSGDAITRSSGVFITHIAVPQSTPGVHTVTATAGTATASGQFTVTAPATTTTTTTTSTTTTTTPPPATTPVLVVAEGQHNVGADIVMTGTGFTPNTQVSINFDAVKVGTATSNANGIIVVVLKTPAAAHGDHTISATDGTRTGTNTFTVESFSPEIPQPLEPEMEVEVKSPITFQWEAAADPDPPSLPVKYQLQVSISEGFGNGSVIIDKKDLSALTYTLTDAEELKLEGRTAPYYWRLRAADAAANYSPWTGNGVFYLSGPSGSLPSWVLYTIMGVGAVLVFLIGYWFGRRSAFYY